MSTSLMLSSPHATTSSALHLTTLQTTSLVDNPDPVRLWDAVDSYAGAVIDLSGSQLHDRINAWTWPTGAGSGSYHDQVTAALREFMTQATLVQDPDCPFSEALACRLFRAKMPHAFHGQCSVYESIRRLHVLNTRAQQARAHPSLVTVSRESDALTLLQALATQFGVTVFAPPTKITHDRTSGPPTPKHQWCDHFMPPLPARQSTPVSTLAEAEGAEALAGTSNADDSKSPLPLGNGAEACRTHWEQKKQVQRQSGETDGFSQRQGPKRRRERTSGGCVRGQLG